MRAGNVPLVGFTHATVSVVGVRVENVVCNVAPEVFPDAAIFGLTADR